MPLQMSGGFLPAGSDTDQSVRASIERIIHTRKGERPMRPGVGSRVWDFAFENVTSIAKARIRSEARRAISSQETRIQILSVTVKGFDELPGLATKSGFQVDVVYRLAGQVAGASVDVDPEKSA